VFLGCLLALLPLTTALAYTPQTVYTYDFYGDAVQLKEMYRVDGILDGDAMGAGALLNPQGLYIGGDGLIYLCDSGNGRVLVLDRQYRLVREIREFIRPDGTADMLNYPTDVCLSPAGELFIADQRGQRIVALDRENCLTVEITSVTGDAVPDGFKFIPYKLVVDSTGRLYAVSYGSTNGIMELSRDGLVYRFMGGIPVNVDWLDYIWRLIGSETQYSRRKRAVPTEYNNITLTDEDFLFGTIGVINFSNVMGSIDASLYRVRGTRIVPQTMMDWIKAFIRIFTPFQEASGHPIKKLNLKGNDILRRNGYQAPVGDIQFYIGGDSGESTSQKIVTEVRSSIQRKTNAAYIAPEDLAGSVRGCSTFVDLAVHRSGVYSALDQKRGRIFTYDAEGVLLYAFGGLGPAEGLFTIPTAICYLDDDLLVLDSAKNSLTVFEPASFVMDIYDAYDAYEAGDYEAALNLWQKTIQYCTNFDVGYIGGGRALLRLGRYGEAMDMFKTAQYRLGYDSAFALSRADTVKEGFGVALSVAALGIILWIITRKWFKKRRSAHAAVSSSRFAGFTAGLAFAKRTSLRPFDGFYDLKYEHRGTLGAATAILALNVAVAIIKRQLSGFIFNASVLSELDVIAILISVALPVLLFVAANAGVTTLLEGEGSAKDIYICVCYAMFPMIFINLLGVALSNVLTLREISFLTMTDAAATLWFGFLLFFGIGVTHQYTVKRNLLSMLLSVLGMLIIIFICLLFFTLIDKIQTFVLTLANEVSLRN
jgi:tetratricopeptide (TPR) repeat protein